MMCTVQRLGMGMGMGTGTGMGMEKKERMVMGTIRSRDNSFLKIYK